MTNKAQLFNEWLQQMDWEGGYEGLARHGHEDSGVPRINSLMGELEFILRELDNEVNKATEKYRDELDEG